MNFRSLFWTNTRTERSAMSIKPATVVDVRTAEEFDAGHVPGAVHIPLNEVPQRLDELRAMATPLVLCCASGGRSGQATQYLLQRGLTDVHNGGPWQDVLQTIQTSS